MFISTKRAVALTCGVFVFVLLTGYQSIKYNFIPNPLHNVLGNGTFDRPGSLAELKPFWTTEQLEPRFAYVQYATDINYLCNAVCLPYDFLGGGVVHGRSIANAQTIR